MTAGLTPDRGAARKTIRFRDVFLAGFLLLVCCGAVGLAAALLWHPSPASTDPITAGVRPSPAVRADRVQVRQILLRAAFGKRLTATDRQTLQSVRRDETGPAVSRKPEIRPRP